MEMYKVGSCARNAWSLRSSRLSITVFSHQEAKHFSTSAVANSFWGSTAYFKQYATLHLQT